ncbi:rhomboid family intramembrane serine protease [Maribacter algicola]|uniref:Rhomboid family intramembrane serine protease n=1 Tax=Meishania litoralis TaxID=3434685 RepID=A0ACC7LH10_9FLAO
MSEKHYFRFSNSVLIAPLAAVLLIWIVFWVELRFRVNFNALGIEPRTFSGLKGVVLSPFIHGSLAHLYNNTIPLAILLASLFYFYREIALKVLVWGILISGLITWAIGRPSFHIGASGVIYLLASFIFFKGIFTKYYRLVALSMMVVFIYGSLLWYIFPVKDEISWEGHLGGFIAGIILAFFMKAKIPIGKKFDWEREDFDEENDAFLQQFDEDGNFIESQPKKEDSDTLKITYHIKREAEEGE